MTVVSVLQNKAHKIYIYNNNKKIRTRFIRLVLRINIYFVYCFTKTAGDIYIHILLITLSTFAHTMNDK